MAREEDIITIIISMHAHAHRPFDAMAMPFDKG
jgi:hypothetical protein